MTLRTLGSSSGGGSGLTTTTGDVRYRQILGANLQRTLAKLRRGEAITMAVLGDSKADPATPGNAAGGPGEKLRTALLAAFPGSSITLTNQAKSGNTMAQEYLEGYVTTALAAVPDLTLVIIGTNDKNSDENGRWAAGYQIGPSLASLERFCAYVRDVKEDAEFIFAGSNPYNLALNATSNTYLDAYNQGLKGLAATVGAEYVDVWGAFVAQGTWSSYLYDSTHPNAAGNDLSVTTLMKHFPTTAPAEGGPASALAARPTYGRFGISKVDSTKGSKGYVSLAAAGTSNGVTLAYTGAGWVFNTAIDGTGSGTYDVTSTAGDYFEITCTTAREFHALIDLTLAASPVVDVALDGVTVGTNIDLHAQSSKNSAAYWLPLFTDLDGASHVARVTLKSGRLGTSTVAALVGGAAAFTKETKIITLAQSNSTATAIDSTNTGTGTAGNYTTILDSNTSGTALALPTGWISCDVIIHAQVELRVSGTTTSARQFNVRVRHASTAIRSVTYDVLNSVASGATAYSGSMPVTTSITGMTANTQYRIDVRMLSTDKTNAYYIGYGAYAVLVRTA